MIFSILNKFSKIFLSFFTFFLLINSISYAETKKNLDGWENINWSEHNIKFSLPSDLKETENTVNKYVAENKNITFEIYPWKDKYLNEKDIADKVFSDLGIEQKGLKIISKNNKKINGFSCYEIVGNGTLASKSLNFSVLGFINPKTSKAFATYVLYWSNGNKDKSIEIEKDIIESIMSIN